VSESERGRGEGRRERSRRDERRTGVERNCTRRFRSVAPEMVQGRSDAVDLVVQRSAQLARGGGRGGEGGEGEVEEEGRAEWSVKELKRTMRLL